MQLSAVLLGHVLLALHLPGARASGNDTFHKAVEMFRVKREDGQIEFVDNEDLYEGPASKLPLHVVAMFGTTSGGKSTTCRFLSCALGTPTDFPSSTIGPKHLPTRGLWGSHIVDTKNGRNLIILDIEGHDNSEQDQKVSEAVLKLLALLSEVTSVFVQIRRTATIQSSDMERIASFVSKVRSTLLKRPVTETVEAGPNDNFPALLIAHVLKLQLEPEDVARKALEITQQALEAQPDVIKTINENYIELTRQADVGLHFDYLPIYELPMGKKLQQIIDQSTAPSELRRKVDGLIDYNQDEDDPAYRAGHTFLNDIDALAGKIMNLSRPRLDGQGRMITAESFRQLLRMGVEEMNQVGPLTNVHFWENIEIDSCTRQLQEKIEEVEATLTLWTRSPAEFWTAVDGASQELDDFFRSLMLKPESRVSSICKEVLDKNWELVKAPLVLRNLELEKNNELEQKSNELEKKSNELEKKSSELEKKSNELKKERQAKEYANRQMEREREAAKKALEEREEELKRLGKERWNDYIEHNFPWVAMIFASSALIVHKVGSVLGSCCSCFKSDARTVLGAQSTEMTLRRMEMELMDARARAGQAQPAQPWGGAMPDGRL